MNPTPARLVLADGTSFSGELFGFTPPNGLISGEMVVNTAMSGYLEAITDPASTGQLLGFSYPQIGNVGANPQAQMSGLGGAAGVVVRELVQRYSNWQATQSLEEALVERQLSVLSGVDTRRLTRQLHRSDLLGAAYGLVSADELRQAANQVDVDSRSWTSEVSVTEVRSLSGGQGPHIVVLDLGVRASTLARLAKIGRLTLVPANTSSDAIAALDPDALVVTSGPGNPALLEQQSLVVAAFMDDIPTLAVGLGAMVLAQALGASTHRLPRRHYGSNIPVRCLATNQVEITSQNRSYGISADSIDEGLVTHRNLNDAEIEGVRSTSGLAQGVTYNPDVGPGMFDSDYLFVEFASSLTPITTTLKGH